MEDQLRSTDTLQYIVGHFRVTPLSYSFKTIAQGYINDSYFVVHGDKVLYVLQHINDSVFTDIDGLMGNVSLALSFLKGNGYRSISVIETKKGTVYAHIPGNGYWRLLTYIPNSTAHDTASDSKIAFEAGKILANFHQLITKAPQAKFKDIIPKFHHLQWRIAQFKEALAQAPSAFLVNAGESIAFAKEIFPLFDPLIQSDMPFRICHNDSKLNNMLFDMETKEALCLIDLDTLMKGYFYYDFGDTVRTVVNGTAEDETDLSKITFDMDLLDSFIQGLASQGNFLTKKEIQLLHLGVLYMPFIHGLRALTDYLEGNHYYKVAYPNQNLDRCKNLFHFVALAKEQLDVIRLSIQKKVFPYQESV